MDVEKLRARIKEIADSPKNVRFEELVALLDNHIGPLFPNFNHHSPRGTHHAFTVGDQTFNLPRPHRGCLKEVYVKKFLAAMEQVHLYEPEGQK